MFNLPFTKKKPLLNADEQQQIVAAIKQAELATSGEVRVYVESKCRFVDPVDRAAEVFYALKMEKTDDHNGVLIYVALKDRQLALFADEGIYSRMGKQYWNDAIIEMIGFCKNEELVTGVCKIATEIGETLKKEFPYQKGDDKNELPDTIVFGN